MGTLDYASGTNVESGKTIGQIQGLLNRVGADRFGYFDEPGRSTIVFSLLGSMFRYSLPMPDPDDERFTSYMRGSVPFRREPAASRKLYQDEVNRRWRALANLIKAELVAVEEGILSIEQAFAGHLLTSRGTTVAEDVAEQIHAIGQGATLSLPWSQNNGK